MPFHYNEKIGDLPHVMGEIQLSFENKVILLAPFGRILFASPDGTIFCEKNRAFCFIHIIFVTRKVCSGDQIKFYLPLLSF